ncbi:transcriptional regulator [Aureimonas altamirensis]|uniref:Transcriptional regulator n=1 Tax=Aureimonas altamirensis TaxID=370622 RepID=A0A0B1Q789_9HYPH|nr:MULTISPECIES: putative glycolipid-binding domain-containing protein [Aureimonas]KHJ54797.1 transcriptional regulator [Aureimonas altamirensis]
MFAPPRACDVRWRPLDGDGLEQLSLRPAAAGGITARGVVIGARGGKTYGVSYRIDCDAGWTIRRLGLAVTDGRRLALESDGNGNWRTADGTALPDLAGCIDVDLAGTPFTNTLPIRRLGLTPDHGTVELSMVYVPFDSFEPVVDGQRYTCLTPARLYRYQAADRTFTADLPVDEDGLVLDYPTLFKRLGG